MFIHEPVSLAISFTMLYSNQSAWPLLQQCYTPTSQSGHQLKMLFSNQSACPQFNNAIHQPNSLAICYTPANHPEQCYAPTNPPGYKAPTVQQGSQSDDGITQPICVADNLTVLCPNQSVWLLVQQWYNPTHLCGHQSDTVMPQPISVAIFLAVVCSTSLCG